MTLADFSGQLEPSLQLVHSGLNVRAVLVGVAFDHRQRFVAADLHTLEENKAIRLGKPIERRVYPAGTDAKGRDYADLRWSRFKNFAPAEMYTVVGEHVFPFMRSLGGDGSTFAHHMKDARFTIPTPALLAKVVDMIDQVPMDDRDTKGDLYEYMLGKIASAGQNGHPGHAGPDRVHRVDRVGADDQRRDGSRAAVRVAVPRHQPAGAGGAVPGGQGRSDGAGA
jgi:hypothetical protein